MTTNIDRAAEVIYNEYGSPAQTIAESLADAGLLTPTPAPRAPVTREQVQNILDECSVSHYHPEYGRGLFTTATDEITDAIMALLTTPTPAEKGGAE